jgi:hypothetical protein
MLDNNFFYIFRVFLVKEKYENKGTLFIGLKRVCGRHYYMCSITTFLRSCLHNWMIRRAENFTFICGCNLYRLVWLCAYIANKIGPFDKYIFPFGPRQHWHRTSGQTTGG